MRGNVGRHAGLLRPLGMLGMLALAGACFLTVDLDDLQGGASPAQGGSGGAGGAGGSGAMSEGGGGEAPIDCPPGAKPCGDDCVSILDPATGCNDESCEPCAMPNATSACLGDCVALQCVLGSLDCDLNAPGCETSASDLDHCNECGTLCQPLHATGACDPTGCGIGTCDSGFDDCDLDDATGCETNIASDPTHCQSCTNDCTDIAGVWTCEATGCEPSPCTPPMGDCITPGVCEINHLDDEAHCGFCDNACAFAHATSTCSSGTCQISSCIAPYANCDGNTTNGCEADLNWNPSHCAACGHSCLGGQCSGGVCQPAILASGQPYPTGLAVDATHVYWLNSSPDGSAGTANRIALTGGASGVLATGLADARGIAVDATHVYFTETQGNRISRVTLTGADQTVVATGGAPWDVVVLNGYVYWAAQDIYRRAVTLGSPPQLIVQNLGPAWDMDLDATHVYVTFPFNDTVQRALQVGGAIQTLVNEGTEAIAVHGGFAYYANYIAPESLRRVPVGGGAPTTLATHSWYVWQIDVDATGVYVADQGNHEILRVPLAGGNPVTLATGQLSPWGLVVTNDSIYWTTYDAGTVMRLAK